MRKDGKRWDRGKNHWKSYNRRKALFSGSTRQLLKQNATSIEDFSAFTSLSECVYFQTHHLSDGLNLTRGFDDSSRFLPLLLRKIFRVNFMSHQHDAAFSGYDTTRHDRQQVRIEWTCKLFCKTDNIRISRPAWHDHTMSNVYLVFKFIAQLSKLNIFRFIRLASEIISHGRDLNLLQLIAWIIERFYCSPQKIESIETSGIFLHSNPNSTSQIFHFQFKCV